MEEKPEFYKKKLIEQQKELEEQLEILKEIQQKLKTYQKEEFLIKEISKLDNVENLKKQEKRNLSKIFSFVFQKIWK